MNQIVEMLDSKTRATFVYNTFGDMLSYTDINGNTVSYGYDSLGRRTSITYPNEKEVFYTYDKNDQLIEVNDEGKLTTYEYDAIGRLTKTYLPNNIQTASTYDVNGNKTLAKEIIDGKVTNRQFSFDKSNKLTEESGEFEVTYTYDKSGNVTQKNHKTTGLIEKFSYNAEDQLVQVENNHGKVITYTYDGFGNRIQKVETTSLQENNFETLTNIATDDNTFNEDYDIEFAKQITKEKLTDLKTTIEEFTATYNQMCPLVTNEGDKEDSQIVLNYVNDINAAYTEVLQVQSQNYEPLYTYTYGVQRIANDKENDTLLYYQYDARGNVIGQQKEDSSALHLKISYNDYGKPNRNLNNEYGYNAESHDYNETQYLRARYYNTDTGRFDQQDSYRGDQDNSISQNRYTYVWNSPNQYIDKSGERPEFPSESSTPEEAMAQHHINNILGLMYSLNISYEEAEDIYWGRHPQHEKDDYDDYSQQNEQSSSEFNRQQAEEAARREAEKVKAEADELETFLRNHVNLDDFDLDSMSDEDRLRLLKHIKKICEDYGLNTEKWDPVTAQDKVNELIPDNESKEDQNIFLEFFDKIMNYLKQNIITPIIDAINNISSTLESMFDFFSALFEKGGGSVNGILFTSSAIVGMMLNGESITVAITQMAGSADFIATVGFSASFLQYVSILNKWLPRISFITDIIGNLLMGYSLFRSILVPSITFLVQTAVNIFVPLDPISKFLINALIGWILPPITNYIFDLIGVM